MSLKDEIGATRADLDDPHIGIYGARAAIRLSE